MRVGADVARQGPGKRESTEIPSLRDPETPRPETCVRTFCTYSRRPAGPLAPPASARSPSLPLALPLRRRQRRSAGATSGDFRAAMGVRQLLGRSAAGVHASAAELSKAGQNPSRPSVTAGQPHPSSCRVNVHAKTTLTEPARPRRWQLSKEWKGLARPLTFSVKHRRGVQQQSAATAARHTGSSRPPQPPCVNDPHRSPYG